MIHHRGLPTYLVEEVVPGYECRCVSCDPKVVESHIEATIEHVKVQEIAKLELKETQAIKDAYAIKNRDYIQQEAHQEQKQKRMDQAYQSSWNEALEEARHQIREEEREKAKTENQRILGFAARTAPISPS